MEGKADTVEAAVGELMEYVKISPSNAYPADIRTHCNESLKRLGTDYLDVYMLH